MFEDLWNHRLANAAAQSQMLKSELAKTERQVEQLLDRILDAETATVVRAYEVRIRKLEEQKAALAEKITNCGRPLRSFDESLRTSLDFLSNPWKLWTSERLEDKRAVLKLTFGDRLAYVRNEGFRTPKLSLPFKVLADLSVGKSKMARPERFELPTSGFVGRRSIQLNYGRLFCESAT